MTEQKTAYIGIGSNLGDREGYIRQALQQLTHTKGIDVASTSDIIETDPLGKKQQPKFLNAVVEIQTSLSPDKLLKTLQTIESSLGRKPSQKWSDRTMDLDILLYGSEIINSPDLTIPHSQMHLRSFVLKGLSQLNPELTHPVFDEKINDLTKRLNDCDFVKDPDNPQLISIAGLIGIGKTTLTNILADKLKANAILEPYDDNPFMPMVYDGRKELALDSELFFLTARAKQLYKSQLKENKANISDYIFDKTLIYAQNWLDSEQLNLYDKIYPAIAKNIVQPSLVIYIDGSIETCLDRIHKRNRPYEQKIQSTFMEKLNQGYDELFENFNTCPAIRITIEDFDCMRQPDIEHLITQIKGYVVM